MTAKTIMPIEENPFFRRIESHDQPSKRGSSPIHRLGREDLVEGAAIVVTTEDIAEADDFSSFSMEYMQEFVEYVSSGLPEVFLRCHPNLLDANTQDEIREVVDNLSDRSLQRYLRSRLASLKECLQLQAARTARISDKKKAPWKLPKS